MLIINYLKNKIKTDINLMIKCKSCKVFRFQFEMLKLYTECILKNPKPVTLPNQLQTL
jgi:hypothetical protein